VISSRSRMPPDSARAAGAAPGPAGDARSAHCTQTLHAAPGRAPGRAPLPRPRARVRGTSLPKVPYTLINGFDDQTALKRGRSPGSGPAPGRRQARAGACRVACTALCAEALPLPDPGPGRGRRQNESVSPVLYVTRAGKPKFYIRVVVDAVSARPPRGVRGARGPPRTEKPHGFTLLIVESSLHCSGVAVHAERRVCSAPHANFI